MQGIFIGYNRPKSKKAVREAIATDAWSVQIEATSLFGNEYDGAASGLPENFPTIYFVGPDPYTSRRFYGSISRKADGTLVVK